MLAVTACTGKPNSETRSAPRNTGAVPLSMMPGPAPRGRDTETASALNASCAGCHQQIAAEWRSSFHARSQRDESYQLAFALEPSPFCQGCHAPEADPSQPVPELAADLGVACVTCHVVRDQLLSATSPAHFGAAPHASLRSAEFAGVEACARCHEFAFPESALSHRPELMQSTVREHAQASTRGVSCASCHLPSVGEGSARHRSHAFPGGHDANFVKAALRVEAARCAVGRACFTLSTQSVGHAFPTGDLFRRLEISVEAVGPDDQVVSSARRFLSRHWSNEPEPTGTVRRVTRDDRPTETPLEVELELDGPVAAFPIAWRVSYQRVDHPLSESEAGDVVGGEIEIASGTWLPLTKEEENHVHP